MEKMINEGKTQSNASEADSASKASYNFQNYSGIRLYIEDPKIAIRRQIRRSLLIILSVLIIGSILIFLSVNNIKKDTFKLQEKQNSIAAALESSNLDPNWQKNWQEISPSAEKIKEALPNSNDLLTYQAALEKTATGAGLEMSINFSQVNPSANAPDKTNKKVTGIDHGLEVKKGDLNKLSQLVLNLEEMPFYVQINSFNITFSGGETNDVQATFSLKVYTQ